MNSAQEALQNFLITSLSLRKSNGDFKFSSFALDVVAQCTNVLIKKFCLFSNCSWRAFEQFRQVLQARCVGIIQLFLPSFATFFYLLKTVIECRTKAAFRPIQATRHVLSRLVDIQVSV
ncbi:hypothetical protein BK643_02615 [Pseudomonas protegens]|nr:hypothetical protein BK643_02615 [Pseudomonas protegens]